MYRDRAEMLAHINHWRKLAPVVDALVKLDRAKPLILSIDEAAVLQQIFTSPDSITPKEEHYS